MTWVLARSIETGKRRTPTTSRASSTGVQGSTDRCPRAIRNPSPIPRKEPSSTKFVK
jgi:hypothetical protein